MSSYYHALSGPAQIMYLRGCVKHTEAKRRKIGEAGAARSVFKDEIEAEEKNTYVICQKAFLSVLNIQRL